MGKVLLETEILREKNMLYYCGTNKKTGNITLCCAEMALGGSKKKSKKKASVKTKAKAKK